METQQVKQASGFDAAAFDLSAAAGEGHTLDVVDPRTGQSLGATVTIVSEYSERVEDWQRDLFSDRQRQERQAKKSGRVVELSFDEIQEQLVQKAVAHTIGWSGFNEGGVPVPYSDAAARKVYRKHRWLRDLVLEEARVLSNFSHA